ncbi:MAG: KH domain-containing protein [bacterium]
MKELLAHIVSSITDTDVLVSFEDNPGEYTFTLTLQPEDVGLIIGKKGSVIKAIRNLLKITAPDTTKRMNIHIASQDQ